MRGLHYQAARTSVLALALLAATSLMQHPWASPPDGDAVAVSAQRLFSSGFEGDVRPLPPVACWDNGCWQDVTGRDSVTGFSWPPRLHDGNTRFLLLTDPVPIVPGTIGRYMFNRIETIRGPDGKPTRALYQEISRNINGRGHMGKAPTQNELQFLPRSEVRELYMRYWLKLQPDLVERMNGLPPAPGVTGGGTWRAVFEFKTGGMFEDGRPVNNGDYRVAACISTHGGGEPYWVLFGDNEAGGGHPQVNDWTIVNREIPVPVGRWFHLEMYWKRSNGADGRVWMAVDGQTIAEHRGPNLGARQLPINRIIAPVLYAGGTMPVYQWVDDLEVWSGMPPR
jgi:hypothetical protein